MVSEKYTTLQRNVRDILGVKVSIAAVVLLHFCSWFFLQSQNVLLNNTSRVFLNNYNGLSRNCVTDITLAKCHGHNILIHRVWQLIGCNTKNCLIPAGKHCQWTMDVCFWAQWVHWLKPASNACIPRSRADTSKLGVHFVTDSRAYWWRTIYICSVVWLTSSFKSQVCGLAMCTRKHHLYSRK